MKQDPAHLFARLAEYQTAAQTLAAAARAQARARAEHEHAADLLSDARIFAEETTSTRAELRRQTDEEEQNQRATRAAYRLQDAELEAARVQERYSREALITQRTVYQLER